MADDRTEIRFKSVKLGLTQFPVSRLHANWNSLLISHCPGIENVKKVVPSKNRSHAAFGSSN
jgi:hypothetical protein